MSDRIPFLAYVRDFELAFLTDDWDRIAPHFRDEAVRRVPGDGLLAADDRGRRAVVAGLRDCVHALDRRFDARIPEIIEGPIARRDGLWMRWRLTFTRAGLPDLEVEGEHLAVYHDGAIALIEEHVAPAAERRVEDYLATHGPALRPAGSAFAPPAALEHKRIRRALLRSSVRAYAAAKSQQDAAGALAGCAPEFAIETIPFGFDTGDRASTAGQLAMFFEAFPDYRAETEGMAVQGDQVAWWGTVSLTSGGPLLGLPPTGRRTALPAFGVFDFHGSDLVRERFHFDLAQLCEGLGLPMGEVVARLEPMRDRPAA